ncbi:hypothetical protein DL766_010448 [Monosporascus sp. MC13-8B]|uniref:Uncharacterized protein n=1 Tax=Monosporascus cannonballus TaxID=155416 RepID=A0ABY0GZ70_9PEZI|nr:hypothetical protein DL762_007412 [Monosporascus cannonballus]RYO84227.1 hypothetical protein DL763_007551 [Monosporascus cannonballus]RYP01802.1 hypothetical protein DL766_010448 [Monosporascus sp. MC13-8B]
MHHNEIWVQRKRNAAIRRGCRTSFLGCKFEGDEEPLRLKYGMSQEHSSRYAICGGAVPIRDMGVKSVVAVVVVSGLKQRGDRGVIVNVIKENWERGDSE